MTRLIDADELKKKKKHSKEFAENVVSVAEIDWQPTVGIVGTVMDAITIERIERYIPEIEDKVPDVALAVKGFIRIWKAEHENEMNRVKKGVK